jgi:hypothetical protein
MLDSSTFSSDVEHSRQVVVNVHRRRTLIIVLAGCRVLLCVDSGHCVRRSGLDLRFWVPITSNSERELLDVQFFTGA